MWLHKKYDRLTPVGDRTRLRSYGQSEDISFGEFSGEIRGKEAACSQAITNGLRKEFATLGDWPQSLE